jgi:hypothetical protein
LNGADRKTLSRIAVLPPFAMSLFALSLSVLGPAQALDRVEQRSQELALPDDYLDPAWPDDDDGRRIRPEESDNVDEERGATGPEHERLPEPAGAADLSPPAARTDRMIQAADAHGGTAEPRAAVGPGDAPEPADDPALQTPDPLELDDEEARDPAQW